MNRPFAGRSVVIELAAREPFRLGGATIDPISREARWAGGEERLQPQILKVLLALAASRGTVVTRDELIELCWDGRFVGDDVLNRSILVLRQFAQRIGGFEIETVPKAGYRLIEHGPHITGRRRQTAIAAVGLIVLATILVAVGVRHRPIASPPANLKVSVTPFVAQENDDHVRRLAVKVQDSAIRMLSESGVDVALLKNDHVTKALPDFVLSGAISGSGEHAVATVQLEQPANHAIVLSRQIQPEKVDPDALPDQVGAALAAALSRAAPVIRLDRLHPSNPAIIASLLNTNQTNFDSQRAFERARRLAQTAPNSAVAQLALAFSTGLNVMVVPASERAAVLSAGRESPERALRLAPNFGNSYVPWCLLHAEVRIAECEARLRKGLAVDSLAPQVGSVLGKLLLNVGRITEALPIAAEALARDAYVPGKIANSLTALEVAGHSDDAEALFRRGHRLWPHYRGFYYSRVGGMTARGDFRALSAFDRQVRASGLAPGYPSLAAPLAQAVSERSLPLARELCRHMADDDLPAIQCMLTLARLGDLDEAFRLADKLYPQRTARTTAEEEAIWFSNPDNQDTFYLTASGAAPLRRDPRYLALAERVGLLRYWRTVHLPDFCAREQEPVCSAIVKGLH